MKSIVNKKKSTFNFKICNNIKRKFLFFIAFFILLYFINNYLFFKAYVPTGSMKPTIVEEDVLLVSKIFSHVRRGDIFVFSHESSKELLIKRVIGLPGETITLKNGNVYVNGKLLNEPYVKNNEILDRTFNVPEDHYLFFGDNRISSFDARKWDNPYVHKKNLDGKAFFTLSSCKRFGFLS